MLASWSYSVINGSLRLGPELEAGVPDEEDSTGLYFPVLSRIPWCITYLPCFGPQFEVWSIMVART